MDAYGVDVGVLQFGPSTIDLFVVPVLLAFARELPPNLAYTVLTFHVISLLLFCA